MNTKTLCLAILSTQDASGYEIKKLSQEGVFSHFVDASFGSIYPALSRMEQEGLVEVREHHVPGKPPSKIYSITPEGSDDFVGALSAPVKDDIHKSEFLMIAMFAPRLERAVVAQALARQRAYYESELRIISENCTPNCEGAMDMPGAQWVGDYGTRVLSNALAYLNENEPRLMAMAGTELETFIAEAAE